MLSNQLPALVRDLEAVLGPRRRRRFRSGYAIGQRFLFVVSDGCPAGRRSNGRDLERAIARLGGPGAGLALFGIGPGTGHVTRFYPNAVADIPVEEFAGRIAALLKSTLGRSLAGARRLS